METLDYHTAGEPFRIVPQLPFEVEGESVLQRRETARQPGSEADTLRQLLVNEPRGHADMYGGMIVPPDDDGADFGVLFWHKDGFSTACGHGTMALGVWAVRSGLVAEDPSGITAVVIDVPSGRVSARVCTEGGRVLGVTFRNVPSRLLARDVDVDTAGFGRLTVDLVWGGATYACLRAGDAGLSVSPEHLTALIEAGRQVKAALAAHPAARHPSDRRLDGVYGTIIFEDAAAIETGAVAQRNVTIFADGQVDRSPCGSGTAARVAALDARGVLREDCVFEHSSIIDTRFTARVAERTPDGVVVDVHGSAFPTAESNFMLDPDDTLGLGFVLR